MNYISQLNAFWQRQAEAKHPLEANAIALYVALLDVANRLRWPARFEVSRKELENKTGVSYRSNLRAIKALKDAKLIGYYPAQGRGKYASFSIRILYGNSSPKPAPKSSNFQGQNQRQTLPPSQYKILPKGPKKRDKKNVTKSTTQANKT